MTNTPGRGHNQPPEPIKPEVLLERLTEDHQDLAKRQVDILAAAARMPAKIIDDTTAGKAGDFIKQINAAITDSETRRRAEQAPFEGLVAVARNFFVGITDPLSRAKGAVADKLTAYQREKDRKARQEADEKRVKAMAEEAAARKIADEQEAAARQALADAKKAETAAVREKLLNEADRSFAQSQDARRSVAQSHVVVERATQVVEASKPDLTRTRGSLGSVQSLRRDWDFKIVKEGKIPRKYMMVNREAILRDIKKAQGKIEIAGIEIIEGSGVAVR